MIFVILGTQDKTFPRLLEKIEQLINKNVIKKKVIVQAGNTKYESKKMEIYDLITMKEFQKYIKESDYIITHGGVGSILDSLKQNKKVIAVPRLKEYNEHENNHQLQIIEKFDELGYIIGCKHLDQLENKIKKLNTFEPKKYKSNNYNMIKLLEDYIDNI